MLKATLIATLALVGTDAISIGLETSTNDSTSTGLLSNDSGNQMLAQRRFNRTTSAYDLERIWNGQIRQVEIS